MGIFQGKTMKSKIIVIVGPTAVGKTALAIEVAQRFNGEVVSGDEPTSIPRTRYWDGQG